MAMKELATATDQSDGGRSVIVNGLNPGFCKTQLFRNYPWAVRWIIQGLGLLLARQPEMGARTVIAAASADEETHGRWMLDCKVYEWPKMMQGQEGEQLARKVWREIKEALQRINPELMGII